LAQELFVASQKGMADVEGILAQRGSNITNLTSANDFQIPINHLFVKFKKKNPSGFDCEYIGGNISQLIEYAGFAESSFHDVCYIQMIWSQKTSSLSSAWCSTSSP